MDGREGGRNFSPLAPRLDSLRASLIPKQKTFLVPPPPLAPRGGSRKGEGATSSVPGPLPASLRWGVTHQQPRGAFPGALGPSDP